MALNFLNGELKGPVRKPTGHEPLATHVNKLLSGALNYHGMPILADTRPVLTGAAGAPKALITKPVAHEPAFRSDIPIPFHENIYNANARHVADIETLGEEAAARKAEARLASARATYVPVSGPIGVMHESNIAGLQSRLLEKRNQLLRDGVDAAQVEAYLEPDYREIRRATIQAAEAQAGLNPARMRAEAMLGAHSTPEEYEGQRARYREMLGQMQGLPAAIASKNQSEIDRITALVEAQVSAMMPDAMPVVSMDEMRARTASGLASTPMKASMRISGRLEFERGLRASLFTAATPAPGARTTAFGLGAVTSAAEATRPPAIAGANPVQAAAGGNDAVADILHSSGAVRIGSNPFSNYKGLFGQPTAFGTSMSTAGSALASNLSKMPPASAVYGGAGAGAALTGAGAGARPQGESPTHGLHLLGAFNAAAGTSNTSAQVDAAIAKVQSILANAQRRLENDTNAVGDPAGVARGATAVRVEENVNTQRPAKLAPFVKRTSQRIRKEPSPGPFVRGTPEGVGKRTPVKSGKRLRFRKSEQDEEEL